MPTPTTSGAVSAVSLSGSVQVDALVGGVRWASANVSYSFGVAGSVWSTNPYSGYGASTGNGEPWQGYATLSSANKAAVRSALDSWAAVSQLKFTEVTETAQAVGDLRFAFSSDVAGGYAAAYFPAQLAVAGDVWFDTQGSMRSEAWTKGSYEFMAVLHEIGHALGLKHPFEQMDGNGNTLPTSWDSRSYTVMSYSAQAGNTSTYFSYEPTTPMLLDVQAIQRMYGTVSSHAGNDTYVFQGSSSYHQTIWDTGGSDTLRYDSATGGTLNLNSGDASKLGAPVHILDTYGQSLGTVKNVWIAYGSVIENAIGGSGNDKLIGNSVGNRLDGGAGNDSISGGAGADRLDGGTGIDTLVGGAGNDSYIVDTASDVITETSTVTGEIDSVVSSVSRSLGDRLENLTLAGSGNLNGHGNALANTLNGNAGANTLNGLGGNDKLQAGAGNDALYGGSGRDTLTGGTGNDHYWFNSALNASTNVDTLTDFVAADDRFELASSVFAGIGPRGQLAAGAFRLGTAALDANDRIVYDAASGLLRFDADGSGVGAAVTFAKLDAGTALSAADFWIV